jgi:hypothetical protein
MVEHTFKPISARSLRVRSRGSSLSRRINIQSFDREFECIRAAIASCNIKIQAAAITVIEIDILHNQSPILDLPKGFRQDLTSRTDDTGASTANKLVAIDIISDGASQFLGNCGSSAWLCDIV